MVMLVTGYGNPSGSSGYGYTSNTWSSGTQAPTYTNVSGTRTGTSAKPKPKPPPKKTSKASKPPAAGGSGKPVEQWTSSNIRLWEQQTRESETDPRGQVAEIQKMLELAQESGNPYIGIDPSAFKSWRAPWLGWTAMQESGNPRLGNMQTSELGLAARPYQAPEYRQTDIWAQLNRMSPSALAEFREKAKAAHAYDDTDRLSSYGPTTADARVMADLMAEANLSKASDWRQVLDDWVTMGAPGGGGSGDGTGPSSYKQTTYQQTSIEAGRAMLRALMRDMIGREPTAAEVSSYMAALNRAESAEPSVVEHVTDAAGNVTTRTLSNAPEAQLFLEEQARTGNAQERATFQAQNYMSMLMNVI